MFFTKIVKVLFAIVTTRCMASIESHFEVSITRLYISAKFQGVSFVCDIEIVREICYIIFWLFYFRCLNVVSCFYILIFIFT